MRRLIAAALAVAASVTVGCDDFHRVDPGRPAPGAPRLFASDSFWNRPIPATAPLDPDSGILVAELNGQVQRMLHLRRGPWLGTVDSSTPIYVVHAGRPTVRVRLERGRETGRGPLAEAFAAVPLPRAARPATGGDRHLVVWQPSTDRMWEFFGLRRRDGAWSARWGGAMRHVSRSPGYYTRAAWPGAESFWGATGTSLPVAGGVIRVEELRRGRIDHALALNLPVVRAHVFSWPAQRSDGLAERDTAIPEGTRFRLDPRLDLSDLGLPRALQPIAVAAQRYGMVVRDRSSTVALYAEDPSRFHEDPYRELLAPWYPRRIGFLMAEFPWEHLQALPLALCTQRRLDAQVADRPHGTTGECRP